MRFIFMLVLCMALSAVLMGCFINPQKHEISVQDTLQLATQVYPPDWSYSGSTEEDGWGTPDAFLTSFHKNVSDELYVSTYHFLAYNTASEASQAFNQYEAASFYKGLYDIEWEANTEFDSYIRSADQYKVQCAQIEGKFRCAFWGQYGSCIVRVQAPLNDDVLADNEYAQILSYIDSEIQESDTCYTQRE